MAWFILARLLFVGAVGYSAFLLSPVAGDPTLSEDLQQETFQIALRRIRAGELRAGRTQTTAAVPGKSRTGLSAWPVRRGPGYDSGVRENDLRNSRNRRISC